MNFRIQLASSIIHIAVGVALLASIWILSRSSEFLGAYYLGLGNKPTSIYMAKAIEWLSKGLDFTGFALFLQFLISEISKLVRYFLKHKAEIRW